MATPIADFIHCLLSTGEQSLRKVEGLLVPGLNIRGYTPVQKFPDDGDGYRQPFCYNWVTFVDNTWHALMTDLLGNSDTVVWFGKIFAKKTLHKICEVFLYIYICKYIYT